MLYRIFSIFLALAFYLSAQAQEDQPIPPLTAHVIDQSHLLQVSQRQKLEQKLLDFERTHGSQIVILLVATTAPEDIASYANRVADHWKIGRKNVGDGVLIVVADQDRRMRIEIARALEGAIPDVIAKRIIRENITPYFSQGDYYGGLNVALDRLFQQIQDEGFIEPHEKSVQTQSPDWLIMILAIGIIISIIVRRLFGRPGAIVSSVIAAAAAWFMGLSLMAALFVGMMLLLWGLGLRGGPWQAGVYGWSQRGHDNGSNWGSGEGFSSGGGGDFSGGGASGSWGDS